MLRRARYEDKVQVAIKIIAKTADTAFRKVPNRQCRISLQSAKVSLGYLAYFATIK